MGRKKLNDCIRVMSFDISDADPDYVEYDNESYDDDVPTIERPEMGPSSSLLVLNDEGNYSSEEASGAEDDSVPDIELVWQECTSRFS
ncbi:hypothetical protein HHI36_021547 [Cryptolaemus montrouzieri]|uniref:Uncharacterized protein n=1 Tax=Cryptolaemus montrouzieri TaxID=559131 RepID=A0ABD2MY78_9CUCU